MIERAESRSGPAQTRHTGRHIILMRDVWTEEGSSEISGAGATDIECGSSSTEAGRPATVQLDRTAISRLLLWKIGAHANNEASDTSGAIGARDTARLISGEPALGDGRGPTNLCTKRPPVSPAEAHDQGRKGRRCMAGLDMLRRYPLVHRRDVAGFVAGARLPSAPGELLQ